MDEVKQHLAETRVAVSAVLSLSHALVQQIEGLLPTLHDKAPPTRRRSRRSRR
jgi:hypothetical protein